MHYHKEGEDLYCNQCKVKMEGVEYGDVCMRCALFVGFCEECETYSTELVYWFPCISGSESKPIRTEINYQMEILDPADKWTASPYKIENNDKSGPYIDDSTQWVFYCSICKTHRKAHCD